MCASPLSCESCRSQPHVKMSGMQSMAGRDRIGLAPAGGEGERRFGHVAGSGIGDEDGRYRCCACYLFRALRWCCSCSSENLQIRVMTQEPTPLSDEIFAKFDRRAGDNYSCDPAGPPCRCSRLEGHTRHSLARPECQHAAALSSRLWSLSPPSSSADGCAASIRKAALPSSCHTPSRRPRSCTVMPLRSEGGLRACHALEVDRTPPCSSRSEKPCRQRLAQPPLACETPHCQVL